jgi:hypothetical protein
VFGVKDPRGSGYDPHVGTTSRYRCTACGNLTRFDVTTTRRTRAFHHYTVGGELEIEDVEVLEEHVEDVTCRWCGTGTQVVPVSDAEAEAATQERSS